jgi:hypothetical protein
VAPEELEHRVGGLWIHLGGEQGVSGTHSLYHHYVPRGIAVLEPLSDLGQRWGMSIDP